MPDEVDDEPEPGVLGEYVEEAPEDSNVLPLFKKAIDKSPFPLTRADRDWMKCRHDKTEYDEKERTIECRACGKPVDPFFLLVRISRQWDTIVAEQRAAQNEVDRLNEQIAERTKTRAKISRARDARAAITQVDKEVVDAFLDDKEKRGAAETYALLGKWVAQQLRTVGGSHTMLLIEVVDKKTKT